MEKVNVKNIEKLYVSSFDFLKPIETECEYDRLIEITNSFIDEGVDENHPLAPLLNIMFDLISDYEKTHYPEEKIFSTKPTPLGILKFLMEQQDLKQMDLKPVFGSQGIVSEILSGKRELTLKHLRKLADFFNVSLDTFI
jgi:HTH-type transcriptional regulator / antitoxin HigA